MTIRERLIELLCGDGVPPGESMAIVDGIVVSPEKYYGTEGLNWDDPVEGYPDVLVATLWLTARRAAQEYIDEHCPGAWYRPMFADDPAQETDNEQG